MPITRKPVKDLYEEDADETEAETPAPKKNHRSSEELPKLLSGWAGYKRVKETTGTGFAQEFKFTESFAVVKFLEDEPFVSYAQHWLNDFQGKKSYVCLVNDCPLCEIANNPSPRAAFNVLELSPDSEPLLKVVVLGVKAGTQLSGYAEDARMGPLSKHYWALSRTGTKQQMAHNFQLVKAADLEEEWELAPLTKEQVAQAEKKLYTVETFPYRLNRKLLSDVADSVS